MDDDAAPHLPWHGGEQMHLGGQDGIQVSQSRSTVSIRIFSSDGSFPLARATRAICLRLFTVTAGHLSAISSRPSAATASGSRGPSLLIYVKCGRR